MLCLRDMGACEHMCVVFSDCPVLLAKVWDRCTSKARLGVLVCHAEPSVGS